MLGSNSRNLELVAATVELASWLPAGFPEPSGYRRSSLKQAS